MQAAPMIDPGLAISCGEPTWEVARLFPLQGNWTEEEYLALGSNQLVEFSHGYLEVLPMPTTSHQAIVEFLHELLKLFVRPRQLGRAMFAPLKVCLWPGKFREPDVLFMLAANLGRILDEYWQGADLVMEVVSTDNRRHDLETKRLEYARAGISEYWIVDPRPATITVLKLAGDQYVVHGEFAPGERAASALLSGFSVDVAEVFAQALIQR